MIVLDASAAVELLLGTVRGRAVADRIEDPGIPLAAPSLLDVEVAHVVRRLEREGTVPGPTARTAIDALAALDIERYHHALLLPRIWRLRHAVSAYDAAYVSLAEVLEARLLTCDGRLARAPGLPCTVVLAA